MQSSCSAVMTFFETTVNALVDSFFYIRVGTIRLIQIEVHSHSAQSFLVVPHSTTNLGGRKTTVIESPS